MIAAARRSSIIALGICAIVLCLTVMWFVRADPRELSRDVSASRREASANSGNAADGMVARYGAWMRPKPPAVGRAGYQSLSEQWELFETDDRDDATDVMAISPTWYMAVHGLSSDSLEGRWVFVPDVSTLLAGSVEMAMAVLPDESAQRGSMPGRIVLIVDGEAAAYERASALLAQRSMVDVGSGGDSSPQRSSASVGNAFVLDPRLLDGGKGTAVSSMRMSPMVDQTPEALTGWASVDRVRLAMNVGVVVAVVFVLGAWLIGVLRPRTTGA